MGRLVSSLTESYERDGISKKKKGASVSPRKKNLETFLVNSPMKQKGCQSSECSPTFISEATPSSSFFSETTGNVPDLFQDFGKFDGDFLNGGDDFAAKFRSPEFVLGSPGRRIPITEVKVTSAPDHKKEKRVVKMKPSEFTFPVEVDDASLSLDDALAIEETVSCFGELSSPTKKRSSAKSARRGSKMRMMPIQRTLSSSDPCLQYDPRDCKSPKTPKKSKKKTVLGQTESPRMQHDSKHRESPKTPKNSKKKMVLEENGSPTKSPTKAKKSKKKIVVRASDLSGMSREEIEQKYGRTITITKKEDEPVPDRWKDQMDVSQRSRPRTVTRTRSRSLSPLRNEKKKEADHSTRSSRTSVSRGSKHESRRRSKSVGRPEETESSLKSSRNKSIGRGKPESSEKRQSREAECTDEEDSLELSRSRSKSRGRERDVDTNQEVKRPSRSIGRHRDVDNSIKSRRSRSRAREKSLSRERSKSLGPSRSDEAIDVAEPKSSNVSKTQVETNCEPLRTSGHVRKSRQRSTSLAGRRNRSGSIRRKKIPNIGDLNILI
jgi:hypothetical protein